MNDTNSPTYRPALMAVEKIRSEDRARENPSEDLETLVSSIKRVGLLHPPVVTEDGFLVCGARRIEALKKLGRTKIPVRLVKSLPEGLLIAQRDENVERKELTPSEASGLAKRIEPQIAAEAKARQHLGRKGGAGVPAHKGAKLKTRDVVAKQTGLSAKTLNKVKKVEASGRPELVAEMNRTGKVDGVFKKLQTEPTLREQLKKLRGALQKLVEEAKPIITAVKFPSSEEKLIGEIIDLLTFVGGLRVDLLARRFRNALAASKS
jgi:ParB family chromosome partitioning protein